MKSMVRQMCCFLVVASLLLQTAPLAYAQGYVSQGSWSKVNAQLLAARAILCEDNGAKALQSAKAPLDQAQKLTKGQAKADPAVAKELDKGIAKARTEILWNNRNEALAIVDRLIGLTSDNAKAPAPKPVVQPTKPEKSGSVVGAVFGTMVIGVGAVIAAILLGFGQVSHR
jgi:hypothetical protein